MGTGKSEVSGRVRQLVCKSRKVMKLSGICMVEIWRRVMDIEHLSLGLKVVVW